MAYVVSLGAMAEGKSDNCSKILVLFCLKLLMEDGLVIFRIGCLFFRLPDPPIEDFLGVAAPVVVIDSACFIVVRC